MERLNYCGYTKMQEAIYQGWQMYTLVMAGLTEELLREISSSYRKEQEAISCTSS